MVYRKFVGNGVGHIDIVRSDLRGMAEEGEASNLGLSERIKQSQFTDTDFYFILLFGIVLLVF